ncbi:MAG: hypothetical protein RJA70_2866 [Pseudomonadota bacterium]|jgi:hypothetical protein
MDKSGNSSSEVKPARRGVGRWVSYSLACALLGFTSTAQAQYEDSSGETLDVPFVSFPSRNTSPLSVALKAGVLSRTLSYNQPVADVYSHALQPHERALTVLGFSAEWYPVGHFQPSEEYLKHIGIAGGFLHSVGGTTPIGATNFETTFSELNIGLRGRLPILRHELGVFLGWGQQSLVIHGDNERLGNGETDPGIVPDLSISYLRFGPDFTLVGGPLRFGLGAYLRLPTLDDSAGHLTERRWFPDATATGYEFGARTELSLMNGVSVFVAGDARLLAISMHSKPGSALDIGGELRQAIAGGAMDVSITALAGAKLNLPGT